MILKGKKTHILVILAALLTGYDAVTESVGTIDVATAKDIIQLFIVSTLREGMKLIGTNE